MEPQWRKLRYLFGEKITWRYCMGGLLPDWKAFHDPLNAVSRPAQMGPVWMEAAHITGMPINSTLWIHDPPQSSYPACMAVKAARLQSAMAEEVYLRRLRETVMIENKNIAQLPVLYRIAEQIASIIPEYFNAAVFREDMKNDRALEAFRADLQEVQLRQINRFPALIFRKGGEAPLLLTGYRPYAALADIIDQWSITVERNDFSLEDYHRYWGSLTDREIKEVLTGDG
ncbi:MAG: DsbA family protein [Flavisolibacter sp.]|nr:DsbA family protein [Flavisolibacter sp.]MBD0365528.1 DsbA family protein [Flavisolibacter sp.]